MNALQTLKALGPIDLRNVRRDPMLRWMPLFPLLMVVVLRWGMPLLAEQLMLRLQVDIAPYYPLIVSAILLSVPMMFGAVVGFLLLDQRDEQTLTALQVSPLSLGHYLAYRCLVPMVIGLAGDLLLLACNGLVPLSPGGVLLASLSVAPLTPIFALFFACVARNKVQGFALMKVTGLISMPPLAAWFIQSGWEIAFGLFPTYWPLKLFWLLEAGQGQVGVFFLLGMAYQALILAGLLRWYKRAVQR